MYYQSFNPYQVFPMSNGDESFNSRATALNSQRFFDLKEGFESGNILKNEYLPYKNFRIPPVNPTTEKEAKLVEVMSLYDYMHDLNLILDVYPTDKEALGLFREMLEKYKTAHAEYVSKFGPLSVEDVRDDKGTFPYVLVPSPWIN